eukprot:g27721.t1
MFRKTESCSLFAIAAFHMSVFLAIPCTFSDKASQTRSCDSVASAFLSATRNTEVFDGGHKPNLVERLISLVYDFDSLLLLAFVLRLQRLLVSCCSCWVCSVKRNHAPCLLWMHLTDQFFSQCLVSSLTKASQTRSRSSQGRASKEPYEFLKYSILSSGMTTFDGTPLVGFE